MSKISSSSRAASRSQLFECYRLFFSFLVVFAHIRFPGTVGSAINCFARCSVPGFFAISGFFSYGADSRRLARRIRSMLTLTLIAFGIELLWNCILIELESGSSIGYLRAMIPTPRELLDFFFLCLNPVRDTLWYLAAALEVLCILWVYVRFFGKAQADYRPLYAVSICLFAGNLTMGTLSQATGTPVSVFLMRNTLFFGLPMFSMGLFLRQYWQQILDNFSLTPGKLLLLALAGLVTGLGEWFCFGICDVMVGTTFTVVCLMLLAAGWPTVTENPLLSRCIAAFGTLSTVIYVVHSPFIDIYEQFLQRLIAPDPARDWLGPIVVLAMSLAAAVLWEPFFPLCRRLRKA